MSEKIVNLPLKPGIFNETSEDSTGDRWVDGNRVRFYKGQPQTINGWQNTNYDPIEGVARSATDWVGLDGRRALAVGTNKKLYVNLGGTNYDITPLDDSGTLGADPFTTSSGLYTVSVSDTAHGRSVGDYVIFSGASAFNGVTIDGEYTVTSVTDANTYVITHSVAASGSGAGGGATVDYEYLLPIASDSLSYAYGWGASTWGASTWGTPRTTGVTRQLRIWSLATWGEDLLASPRGGKIYAWDYSTGTGTRAAVLTSGSDAPTKCNYLLVSPTTRHAIAFGCNPFGSSTLDPMHIRWCTQNDYSNTDAWEPLETNSAGDQQLDNGSEIISAIETANNEILTFTDTAVYAMTYVGFPFIFNTRLLGQSCGIRGPNARATFGNRVWWMGCEDFYTYDGRVQVLPCDVRSYVFDNINEANRDKVFCGINRTWEEVWWFYPDTSDSEVTRYVAYNWAENNWHIGELDRVVWLDRNEISQTPLAYDASGILYNHEVAAAEVDDAYVISGYFQVDEGNNIIYLDRLIPDFERTSGNISFEVYTKQYPNGAIITKGPFTYTGDTTQKIDLRARGRGFSVKLSSDDNNWRLSSLRARVKPDGRR